MPRHGVLQRLYTGTGAFEIVGRRRRWYLITGIIVAVAILGIAIRGFTLGIDFEGGTRIQFPASGEIETSQVEEVFAEATGTEPEAVQTVGSGAGAAVEIRSVTLDQNQVEAVQQALYERFSPVGADGTASPNAISVADVSETWGGQVTQKALLGLVVFLVLVMVYITIRYERDMAIAAIAALFFDMVVTAGVYAWVGFEVSPATIIGLLTILGFSLYDSVIVFDKVEENTRGVLHLHRRTYAEQANLAVNQTFMRSINTSLISVLPVVALIVVAVWILGVGTLKDLALVQFVGILVGCYSSIFFATPLLVSIKERWGPIAKHTVKVKQKRAEAAERIAAGGSPAAATATATADVDIDAAPAPRGRASSPAPGARPTGKRARKRR
nr:protein translocase subunit SecF [Rhodococcus rhodnii]